MSKEIREQINKVKNFGQFLNENLNTDKVERDLLELIAIKDRMEEMTGEDENHQIHYNLDKTNKEYQTLYKRWGNLIDIIKNYYKKKLTTTFEIQGEEATRQLHKEIVKNLKRNEQYEIRTGVIWFDITDFTRNLIKKA
jgi:predicted nuclease with TOPRIM domain